MSNRQVASKFRLHSVLIAESAVGTAATFIVPVLVDAERQGLHFGAGGVACAAIAGVGIA